MNRLDELARDLEGADPAAILAAPADTVLDTPFGSARPIAVILPPRMAMSASTGSAPDPSMIVPPRITRVMASDIIVPPDDGSLPVDGH